MVIAVIGSEESQWSSEIQECSSNHKNCRGEDSCVNSSEISCKDTGKGSAWWIHVLNLVQKKEVSNTFFSVIKTWLKQKKEQPHMIYLTYKKPFNRHIKLVQLPYEVDSRVGEDDWLHSIIVNDEEMDNCLGQMSILFYV